MATGPGDTALTRIPRGASSRARVWVRLSMPALAAAYGPVRGEPRVPAPDEMLMITPPAAMRLAAALAPWNADVRLSSSWARQISSGVSTSSRTVFSSEPADVVDPHVEASELVDRAFGELARRSRGCRRRRSALALRARRPRSP